MFRLWCKIWDSDRHIIKQTVIENADTGLNRTKKIFEGIKEACYQFDLCEPIWLESNIAEFKRHSKVSFIQDNFIEAIDFAAMEIEVIEED